MKTRFSIFLILFFPILFIHTSPCMSQTRNISGVVTAFGTLPLGNVEIYAEKSGKSIKTDTTGRFSLEVAEKDILRVSAAGFRDRKVKTGKSPIYSVDLIYEDNVKNFNDAVNAGHISERVLRSALDDRAKKGEKDYSKYKSIYDLVASEIYNVKVSGTTIVNRKMKSFDRNPQVLLVVNGKIVPDISDVMPDDVRTIEFIDDVGTTLYGSMGANGVLRITLK